MNWRNVRLIWFRELSDQLRDRRTLFMVAVLPLLLYPAMGVGMMQLTVLFSEQPRTVVVLGADELPDPPLIDGSRFASRWFEQTRDAEQLNVISESATTESIDDPGKGADGQPLEGGGRSNEARSPREDDSRSSILLGVARRWKPELERLSELEGNETPAGLHEWRQLKELLNTRFAQSQIDVLVVVPAHLKAGVAEAERRLRERGSGELELNDYRRPIVVHNSASERSQIALRRVKEVLQRWERELIARRLEAAGLPRSLPNPVGAKSLDLAEESQISANVWSKLLPAMLVLMAMTGAFYPSIDLGAGEKERGTMETLLICPATRAEIVLGKFLTILIFSMSTAALNLTSLGGTGKYMASLAGGGQLARMGDLSLPSWASLAWVAIMLLPIAALFSALCLALATFAKSSKEGQYYLTPLLLATTSVTVFCLSPGVEIQPFYSILPVMGPALLLKGLLLSGGAETELAPYIVPVLASSFAYCAIALYWAIDQFSSEEVLFREAERFDLRLWLAHLLRDKEATPSFSEAIACFVLIMLLQFGAMKYMQAPLVEASPESRPVLILQLLAIQQIAIIATPALMMGILLTTSLRRTFSLRWPGYRFLIGGALLALALHPLTLEFAALLDRYRFFPPLPPGTREALGSLSNDSLPFVLVLLAFAVAPGICEELAFRGFMLSGFHRTGRTGLAVALSAALFGLMHQIPQQVFNAAMLGLLLGLLALRSRSLFPGIVFHVLYNGLEVTRNRFGGQSSLADALPWMFRVEESSLRYQPLLLILCGAMLAAAVYWLVRPSAWIRFQQADGSLPSTGVAALSTSGGLPGVPAGVARDEHLSA